MTLLKLIGLATAALFILGCGGGGGSNTPAPAPASTPVVAPAVSADTAGGTFNTAQLVALTATAGASIFFTTNSSTPDSTSTRYTSPITISTDTVLSFIAIGSSGLNSRVNRETYLIDTIAPMNHALTSATKVISAESQASFPLSIENGEVGASYKITIDDTDANTQEIVRTGRIVNVSSTSIHFA